MRQSEVARLKDEIANLMKSLASGVNTNSVTDAINERAAHLERLEALANVEVPKKITVQDADARASAVRKIAESGDTDSKRSAVRRYIKAMVADAEERTITVMMRSLSDDCRHFLVGRSASLRTRQRHSPVFKMADPDLALGKPVD